MLACLLAFLDGPLPECDASCWLSGTGVPRFDGGFDAIDEDALESSQHDKEDLGGIITAIDGKLNNLFS